VERESFTYYPIHVNSDCSPLCLNESLMSSFDRRNPVNQLTAHEWRCRCWSAL